MVIVQVCVGSSCHLRCAPEIVDMLQKSVDENSLDGEVILMGGFCAGKCNPRGVTVTVNDEVYPGINKENYQEFWNDKIMSLVNKFKG